jgi:hypothetical protein
MMGFGPLTTFPAGTAILPEVAEMKVKGTATPLKVAVQFEAKFVPLKAMVVAAPTYPDPGVSVPITGAEGGVTPVKLTVLEDWDCALADNAAVIINTTKIIAFFIRYSPY